MQAVDKMFERLLERIDDLGGQPDMRAALSRLFFVSKGCGDQRRFIVT